MIPGLGITIADLTGWGVAAALGIYLVMSVVRGWFVPGRIFREVERRATAADATIAAQARALDSARIGAQATARLLSIPLEQVQDARPTEPAGGA